jgi:hypothetical protein
MIVHLKMGGWSNLQIINPLVHLKNKPLNTKYLRLQSAYSDIKSTCKLSIIKNREISESFYSLELAINDLNILASDRDFDKG